MRHRRPAEITDADVRSLAVKLRVLHAMLAPSERTLLRTVLGRAAGNKELSHGDVEGFVWRTTDNPFVYLDRIGAGSPVRQDRLAALRRRLGELQ